MIGAFFTIAGLELRHMARGKKLLVLGLLFIGAAALAFTVRRFAEDPGGGRWPQVFLIMMTFVFLQTLVIMVPLLYMTSTIRDEIEEGTFVYLITRPVPKPLILAAKFAAAALFSSALLAGGMALFLVAFRIGGGGDGPDFDWGARLAAFIRAGVVGVVGYGAIFTFVGLVSKRALIWGIAYGFLSEFILTNVPAVIKKLTVMYYLRSIALGDIDRNDFEGLSEMFDMLELTSPSSAVLTVGIAAALFLAVSLVLVSVLEFRAGGGVDST
jgi:ABC-2 type transport system permease protein